MREHRVRARLLTELIRALLPTVSGSGNRFASSDWNLWDLVETSEIVR